VHTEIALNLVPVLTEKPSIASSLCAHFRALQAALRAQRRAETGSDSDALGEVDAFVVAPVFLFDFDIVKVCTLPAQFLPKLCPVSTAYLCPFS
jgi:hypothetical protein